MTGDPPPGRPLTAEDVVRRIAAECAFISANGEVGIRLRLAAALVRQYGISSDERRRGGSPGGRSPLPCFDSVWRLVQSSRNHKKIRETQ